MVDARGPPVPQVTLADRVLSSPTFWGWRAVALVLWWWVRDTLRKVRRNLSTGGNVRRMPRPAEVPGKPAEKRVTFRVNDGMLAYINKARGERSQGAYLRDLIRADAKRRSN